MFYDHSMKSIIIYSTLLLLILGCNSSTKNNRIYFGGQIKNPKCNEVYIYKNDVKIDSSYLNEYNHFMFALDSLQSGLYQFKHGEEFQYIYLEPQDSLLIRLNTWDFDGSLVFSGRGSNRNNFLIQLFLENELEERLFYNYFKLDETDFTAKVDSFFKLKNILYTQFKENSVNQSKAFMNLVDVIMDYSIYANKEKYPLHYKKLHHTSKLPKLSSSYYNYRHITNKNYNDSYVYKQYLKNQIYNKAYYELEKDTSKTLSYALLNQVTQLINNTDAKDAMLQQLFINSLIDNSYSDYDKKLIHNFYFNNSHNEHHKKEVTSLLKIINTFKKGEKLPEFYVKTIQHKVISTNDFLDKNTVLYFWPKEKNRIRNMAKRVNYLINKYPNIKFIGIDGQLEYFNWESSIKTNHLDPSLQFQLVDKNTNLFYSNNYPRAVIINSQGIVQNNFTFISLPSFEKNLH